MTVHRNRCLVNNTNSCTEFQFYWYYGSTYFGKPFCPSSGVLNRTSALVHFTQLWWPFATRSRMGLQLRKMYQSWCTAKNSWWWAERLPETCGVVIPIKLEFSATVGFIHKGYVTMHGHTILKEKFWFLCILFIIIIGGILVLFIRGLLEKYPTVFFYANTWWIII